MIVLGQIRYVTVVVGTSDLGMHACQIVQSNLGIWAALARF